MMSILSNIIAISPIIFKIGPIAIRWYGLLFVLGLLSAIFYATWYFKRNNEDPEIVNDIVLWLVIPGIIGARLWYVFADILGGDSVYLQDPSSIIKIWEGGINILGGIIFAVISGLLYCRRHNLDFWFIVDAFAPGYLIGQAVGRPGNFINQELYGPPTNLPWGIKIEAMYRIEPWTDMNTFPYETTRFHPSFAYEIIWNLFFAAVLIFIIIRYKHEIKNGFIGGLTLIIIGIGRAIMEAFFRPDQPKFFGLPITTSMIVSIVFLLLGVYILLGRMEVIKSPFFNENNRDRSSFPKNKKKKRR